MKKILAAILGLTAAVVCAPHLYAAEITAESTINKVTVYPNAALISRHVTTKLPAGIHSIIIPGIVSYFDENSLRVTGQGNEEIKIYSAQARKKFLTEDPSARMKELNDQIQKVSDDMRIINNRKEVLAQKRAFLDSLRIYADEQLPKEMVTKMPQTSELESMLKFYDSNLSDNFAQLVDCDNKLRDLQEKLNALQAEQAKIGINQGTKMRNDIIVDVETAKATSADFFISYLIPGSAYWHPVYDARADINNKKTEVVCYGLIAQHTGEDWNDVELSLTTSKPTTSGRMPEPETYFVRPFIPAAPEQYADFKKDKMQHALRSSKTMLKGVMMEAENVAQAPNELLDVKQDATMVYATSEQKGIAVVYKTPRKVTIKADNTEQKVPVFALNLDTDYVYFANPAASQAAYLGAEVINTSTIPLLTGKTNVFLDGDLVSSSIMENIRPQEKFNFYFGADEDVKVLREELEKKTDTILIGNIQSSTIKITYKYKITIENYKSKKIVVNLFESLPVSQDERIKVKIGEVSLAPTGKDYKDRPGVWMWKLEIAPSAKQEIFYTYTVERPRDLRIENIIN